MNVLRGTSINSISAIRAVLLPAVGRAGKPPAIPYLAGQYAHYTAFEREMWRRGFRKSSLEGMAEVAKRLDEQDIPAVAAYFQRARASASAAAQAKE